MLPGIYAVAAIAAGHWRLNHKPGHPLQRGSEVAAYAATPGPAIHPATAVRGLKSVTQANNPGRPPLPFGRGYPANVTEPLACFRRRRASSSLSI